MFGHSVPQVPALRFEPLCYPPEEGRRGGERGDEGEGGLNRRILRQHRKKTWEGEGGEGGGLGGWESRGHRRPARFCPPPPLPPSSYPRVLRCISALTDPATSSPSCPLFSLPPTIPRATVGPTIKRKGGDTASVDFFITKTGKMLDRKMGQMSLVAQGILQAWRGLKTHTSHDSTLC